MADVKLVGAVAIKVRPDAGDFREEAQKQLKKEARDLDQDVKLNAKLDAKEAKQEAEKVAKEIDGKTITWNVKLDRDAVRAAQRQLDQMKIPTKKVEFDLDDKDSIKRAEKKLERMAQKAKVRLTYVQDEQGYQSVLDRIAKIRREKLEKKIKFKTDDESLNKLEQEMRDKLEEITGPQVIDMTERVNIEYHEDREGFKAAIDRINQELRKLDALNLDVELNREELLAARDLMQEEMDKQPLIFKYNEDEAGYKKILKHIKELQDKKAEIDIDLNLSDAELAAKAAEIQAKLDALTPAEIHTRDTITFEYNYDREGLQSAIKEIDKEIRKLESLTVTIDMDKDELIATRDIMQGELDKIPVKFEYDRNVKGLEKAIAQIDEQLAKHAKVEIESTLDWGSLILAKATLEEELSHQKIHFEYEEGDLSSLKAARARIMALLPIEHKTHLTAELNEASLLEQLAKLDAMIKAATPEVKPKVKPELKSADILKVATGLAILTKSQTVDIFVKLNNASVLLAAAKLTGLRAASRWTEAFARSLGTLDRNLPVVAAAVVGLNTMTSGVLTLTAAAFSLGNELGQVVRMAALLGPAMILGYAAIKTVFTGVFKDFGAAVNGDKDAIKKLTASGKEAAANMRVIFQDIRETVSQNFWKAAGDNMLEFTKTALPQVKTGMSTLSTTMGETFGAVVDAASRFAKQDGFTVFFANLNRGMESMRTGLAPFMSAFLNLAALGSTIFPRLGAAFEIMSNKFDSWVTGLALDGTFSRWIDQGVQGIKDLWSAGMSLIGVWKNIGQAAQGAGALTLHSFAGTMAELEKATASDRFQKNLLNIFRGAREASDELHTSLGKLGPVMDVFSITMANALANSGKALSAFIGVVGDVLSSKNLDTGLTAFLSGVKTMFEQLRPAAAPLSEIIKTFGLLLGQVASDSGPLFRNLFEQIANVLTVAYTALAPFLPALIQIGTSIVNVLGPALANVASQAIPAFVSGILKIGDGLIPVIKAVSDFAVGVVGMVSDLPTPLLVGMATAILAVSGAMKFAATVLPVVNAALKIFGATAALTGTQMTLAIPVVGIFLAAITGLAAVGLTSLASAQTSGTKYANDFAAALEADAKAAGKVTAGIGDMTRAAIVDNLVKEGAYSKAKQLGIGVQDLTDAALKGGSAWDKVQGIIKNAKDQYADTTSTIIASQGEVGTMTDELGKNRDAAEGLGNILDNTKGSIEADIAAMEQSAEAHKAAGIQTDKTTDAQKKLAEQIPKTSFQIGAAASATNALADQFSSSAAKIDAMRKTFEILLGKDAKQAAAETLGEYTKGFQELKDTVTPLAGKMQELGDAAYGDNGFLNVAGGNKAVLQVNQALVDQVNNTWAGAKQVYDNAIQHGDNAKSAFEQANKFITDHKGDYDQLAKDSGLSAEQVQGQWDAVFGHPWVLKVSLEGATEAAARAQQMITLLGGQWDLKTYTAYMDANPDKALLQISNPTAAAQAFVDHQWMAQLDALPDAAQEKIKALVGATEEVWDKGDFQAILTAAQKVPGLAEVLVQIMNGASNNGQNWQAILYAAINGMSLAQAQATLDGLANSPRTAYINSVILPPNQKSMDLFLAQNGGGGSRNGSILDGAGRGMFGFNAERLKFYANGGIENHVAQITKPGGPIRVWSEPETQGEAYVPLAASKRPRSLAILNQVAKQFGYTLTKNAQQFSAGGLEGHASPTNNTTNASVSIGNLYTVDADEAVRKIRNSQVDALAVAGITLNGA